VGSRTPIFPVGRQRSMVHLKLGGASRSAGRETPSSSSALWEEVIMQRSLGGTFVLALGLAVGTVAAISLVPRASGQTGPGWTVLLDDKTMGEWDKVGETNWRLEDGAVVADKRTSQDAAHLVSKQKYKDFQIYAEFWASDDANSGIFIRCQDPAKITDRS